MINSTTWNDVLWLFIATWLLFCNNGCVMGLSQYYCLYQWCSTIRKQCHRIVRTVNYLWGFSQPSSHKVCGSREWAVWSCEKFGGKNNNKEERKINFPFEYLFKSQFEGRKYVPPRYVQWVLDNGHLWCLLIVNNWHVTAKYVSFHCQYYDLCLKYNSKLPADAGMLVLHSASRSLEFRTHFLNLIPNPSHNTHVLQRIFAYFLESEASRVQNITHIQTHTLTHL